MLINLNYHISIFETMGVVETQLRLIYNVAHRAPLLKFLESPLGLTIWESRIIPDITEESQNGPYFKLCFCFK